MSSSPVIPKEKLSAYQRWELHDFDSPGGHQPTPAESAVAAAAEKVRHIHQHAYEAGRADGLREGSAQAVRDTQSLRALLAGIESQSHELNQRIAHDVLELALELARQMLRQALAVRPEIIVTLVHDAMARTTQPAAQAAITLNPADAVLVRAQLADELAAGRWRIVEDAGIARGGCMLQTAATQIDATAQVRWQRLAAALGQTSDWLA